MEEVMKKDDPMVLNPEVVRHRLVDVLTGEPSPPEWFRQVEVLKEALDVLRELGPQADLTKAFTAAVLRGRDPTKPAGTELCDAVMRFWTTNAFEALLFRRGEDGRIEVFLRQRSADDTAYPLEWHAPGSLYRHGEQDADVAGRLQGEFGCEIGNFELVGRHITSEARGTIMSLLFLVEALGAVREDDRHRWFPIDQLPERTVDFHRNVYIPAAAKAWVARDERLMALELAELERQRDLRHSRDS